MPQLSYAWYLGFIACQIFILYFFSHLLLRSISLFCMRWSKDRDRVVGLVAGLLLTGTIVHEIAHVVVARLLLVKTGRIEVVPKLQGGLLKLGTAEVARTDIIRSTLIGLAPVMIGLSLILGISYLMTHESDIPMELNTWSYVLAGYLLFIISNTMFSSRKDLEGSAMFFVIVAVLAAGAVYFGLFELPSVQHILTSVSFSQTLSMITSLLFIPMVIDILFLIFFYFLNRIRG
jgi:hypothetical protein